MIIQFIILILSFTACLILSFSMGVIWEKQKRMAVNLEILREIRKEMKTPEEFEELTTEEKEKEVETMFIRRGIVKVLDIQDKKLD